MVSDQVIISLAHCIKNGFPVFEVLNLPVAFWKQISLRCISTLSSEVQFFGKYLIHELVSFMDSKPLNNIAFSTGGIFIGSENMLVKVIELICREIPLGYLSPFASIIQFTQMGNTCMRLLLKHWALFRLDGPLLNAVLMPKGAMGLVMILFPIQLTDIGQKNGMAVPGQK
jgi:hypothetical protein